MTQEAADLKPKFKVALRRQEAEFAGFRCSRRGCMQLAYGPAPKKFDGKSDDEDSNAFPRGQAAHIFSSSLNGPRGQGGLSEEKLAGANNCVHVCPNCHNLIDSATSIYTVDILVEMKWLHRIIVRVINLNSHLESRLIKGVGVEGSERYLFEEFLLNKVPTLVKKDGAVPSKPKVDEVTLNAYVNEFFSEKKPIQLDFSSEERLEAAKKLKSIYLAHWDSRACHRNCGLEFRYTLTAVKQNGERIRTGETYRFYRQTNKAIALFQNNTENSAELSHEIGFDISGLDSSGIIEFHVHRVRISTNFTTAEFLQALSAGAKVYYDVEVLEVVDNIYGVPWRLNRGELSCRWRNRHDSFSKLKALYTSCLQARCIAEELGVNFLPQFNDASSRGGVRPNDVSGLLVPGLSNETLRNIFYNLSNGRTQELVKFRSTWSLKNGSRSAHIECYLIFTKNGSICKLNTRLVFIIEPQEKDAKTKAIYLSDDEFQHVDYIGEMHKPSPEGDILRQLKSLIQ